MYRDGSRPFFFVSYFRHDRWLLELSFDSVNFLLLCQFRIVLSISDYSVNFGLLCQFRITKIFVSVHGDLIFMVDFRWLWVPPDHGMSTARYHTCIFGLSGQLHSSIARCLARSLLYDVRLAHRKNDLNNIQTHITFFSACKR